jgi:uncharacterized protein
MAVNDRGTITEGAAPDLPDIPGQVDLILLLDMLHYLDDHQLQETLRQSLKLLTPGGLLAARFVVRLEKRRSFYWFVEDFRARFSGIRTSYRTPDELTGMMSGFDILQVSPTENKELFWLVGRTGNNDPEQVEAL